MAASPAPTGRRKGCFAFVASLSPFKSSRRPSEPSGAPGTGFVWGRASELSVHKPENLEQRFLLSENIAEPDDEHRPLRVASSLKLSAIPAAEPAASASHTPRGPSGAEGVGATAMLGFDFAKAGGRMVDALDSALPPRRAPKGEDAMPLKVEGRAGWGGMAVEITKVPEVPARADKDKGSELVMPAFGGGHSSAQNMPKVEGLQLVSPQSGTREGGRTKISDDSSQMAFVPPPVPSKSMRPQERGYQDDEDDTQMCPFCRKVQSGDASDDKCKDCGLSLQVDDMAFMQIALGGGDEGDGESKPPIWALPDAAAVNLHKVFVPRAWLEVVPIPPEPQLPSHRPYRKTAPRALQNGTPVKGGREKLEPGSMTGWMCMPVSKPDEGVGEKYRHLKVSRRMFVRTSKVIYANATHPDAPIWVDDDIDDGRSRQQKGARGVEGGGDVALGGVWDGITQGLGSLWGEEGSRGRYRGVANGDASGVSKGHTGWQAKEFAIEL